MTKKINIVLIDDHTLFRSGIKALLSRQADCNVVGEAADGFSGVKLVEQLSPDVVLLDLDMPVMNGQETVNTLRSLYPNLHIIALSVNDQLSIIREMIKLGANAYLFKDSSPEMFKTVLLEVHSKGFYYDKQVIKLMKR